MPIAYGKYPISVYRYGMGKSQSSKSGRLAGSRKPFPAPDKVANRNRATVSKGELRRPDNVLINRPPLNQKPVSRGSNLRRNTNGATKIPGDMGRQNLDDKMLHNKRGDVHLKVFRFFGLVIPSIHADPTKVQIPGIPGRQNRCVYRKRIARS